MNTISKELSSYNGIKWISVSKAAKYELNQANKLMNVLGQAFIFHT